MERIVGVSCGLETHLEDKWLTRAEVANRLRLPVATLNGWASKRLGPPYGVFGRHARYRLADIIAWENEQVSATDRRGGVAR